MTQEENKKENLKPRPPVIVVMGHVDHGKTTLLDFIRKANIAGKEAGGITQSVSAYEIEYKGHKLTFIDTPGHEAFAKMRSHGANVADLAILVVAADDGVKPQTKESIKILQESKTPFIVAINKIDKNNADLERAKRDLLENGVPLEGLGGNVSWQAISAKDGQGVSELLDLAVLASEMEELTYDPSRNASGVIIEAKLDKNRGREVLAILKDGTLKVGEDIISDSAVGKIKILENFAAVRVKSLEPSSPAIIIGFENLPAVGANFEAGFVNLAEVVIKPKAIPAGRGKSSLSSKASGGSLNLIIKADTAGSLEALHSIILALPKNENLSLNIISEKIGEISDGDVKDAINLEAVIVGFGVKVARAATNLSEAHKIEIITSEIIYELVKSVEEKISHAGKKEEIKTRLSVLAVFNSSGSKQTIGGRVEEGALKSGSNAEVKRGEEILGRVKISNLQCNKQDVRQVEAGKECGLVLELSSEFSIEKGDELII